ncbi:hypothetical protein F5B20DRAFT_89351 [Whalleya microplaca]|nr:hypothetical protein F5B20DRAFT_89351 [Whalleya microplaca]
MYAYSTCAGTERSEGCQGLAGWLAGWVGLASAFYLPLNGHRSKLVRFLLLCFTVYLPSSLRTDSTIFARVWSILQAYQPIMSVKFKLKRVPSAMALYRMMIYLLLSFLLKCLVLMRDLRYLRVYTVYITSLPAYCFCQVQVQGDFFIDVIQDNNMPILVLPNPMMCVILPFNHNITPIIYPSLSTYL